MTIFHVRHDFNPVVARDVLLILRTASVVDEQQLLEFARTHDFEVGKRRSAAKVLTSLRDLGLLTRAGHNEPFALTPLGTQIADVALHDELLLAELIHLRYSWLWTEEHGGEAFSWAYQAVTKQLWDEAPASINSDRLVTNVIAGAQEVFDVKGASFSSSSVLGILHWLRALSPPCIVNGTFRQRPACSPEALLITLEAIAAISHRPAGTAIRMDAATRQRVCRTLVIDHEAFDEVVAQAEDIGSLVRHRADGGEALLILEIPFCGLAPFRSRR
jgi:hypothetical protein